MLLAAGAGKSNSSPCPRYQYCEQALSQFPKYLLPAMLWSERDDAEYLAFRRGGIANL